MRRKYSFVLLGVIGMALFVGCGMRDMDRTLGISEELQNADGENEGEITKEEAEAIVLDHAGFTADSVLSLHTEYEIDDGVPEYDVQFDKDGIEYDYSIHAETGEIIFHEKEND